MNGHQIVAILELALYATLFPLVAFCTFHYLFKKQTAWLYLHAFVIAKIAGPAIYLSIAEKAHPSRDLQMASQILYSIALGPLLSATLSFINSSPAHEPKHSDHDYQPQNANDHTVPTAYLPGQQTAYTPLTLSTPQHQQQQRYQHQQRSSTSPTGITATLLRLLHPLIIVALILGIISGIDRAPSSSSSDKLDRGATLAKASSALFMLALAGIALGAALRFRQRRNMPAVARYILTAMPALVPLLFLRVLYSVLGAANLDTSGHGGHTRRYNVLSGSWAVYLVLGAVPQGVVLGVYTVCGVGAWWRGRRGVY
ncbi:hypothetical protein BJX64DRAFT_293530 [Aspergillus heterothallicus]